MFELPSTSFKRQMRQLGREEARRELLEQMVKNGMISEEQRKQIETQRADR